MTWNYRVFREENGDYVIREVFYDEDGCILSCTEDAVAPFGGSPEELAKDIEWFKEALDLPVLTLADIPCRSKGEGRRDRSENISHEQLVAELGLTLERKLGTELVEYWQTEGLIGARPDITDSQEYARQIREHAEQRTLT